MTFRAICNAPVYAANSWLAKDQLLLIKILRVMKLAAFFILIFNLQLGARGTAQTVSIVADNAPLHVVFKSIKKQTNYTFIANADLFDKAAKVTVSLKNVSISQALDACFKNQPFAYSIEGRIISIVPKPAVSIKPIAPPIEVRGVVTDENENPLQGVSVTIKGSGRGTTTDRNGRFVIQLPEQGGVLVITYIGYETIETNVATSSTLNFELKPKETETETVVVIGYGTQRKRDITGSVVTVDLEATKDVPTANAGRLLVGQAPGVSVKQNTGQPGKEFDILIRGQGSLGAGSAPLYVVDGFPVGTSFGQNLNGDDIESITILKDAVSSAIYGARGSNGVVLVTTKTAKVGQSYTNFFANYGIQNIPKERRTKMMNGPDYAQFKKERFIDAQRYFNNHEPTEDEIPEDFRYPEQTKISTNWYEAIMHNNAPFQNYNLTFANGNNKMRSLLSASYNRQDGAVKYTNFDRFSLRENLEGKVNDFIAVGLKLNGSYVRNRLAATEGRGNVVGLSLIIDPRDPVYNEDGSLRPYIGGRGGTFGWPSPLLILRDVKTTQETGQILSNAFVEVAFLKHFKFRTAFHSFINYTNYKQFVPSTIGVRSGPPPRDARETDMHSQILNYSADQTLTYTNNFGRHKVNAMAGYTAQQETGKTLTGTGSRFPNDLVPFLGSAALRSATSGEFGWTTAAFFGRVNYSFDERFIVAATFRREGSSRFGENNKYGDFPAFSAGWRLFNEEFFPKSGFLSDLKLRGSWGVTGNNAIPNYQSLATLGQNDYVYNGILTRGLRITSLPNPDLRWEKSNTLNLGVDMTALDDRFNFTIEFYNKITSDMLLPVEVPAISGFTSYYKNIGKVRNRGVEMLAGYRDRFGEVGFRVSGNISFNRSKVLEISNDQQQLITGEYYQNLNISKVGRPIGMLLGFKVLGIFQDQEDIDRSTPQPGAIPGVFKMEDSNGDGIISYDFEDMVEIGNPEPKGRYGANLGLDYRGFDLGVLITGAYGYQLYRTIEASTLNMDGVFNVLEIAKNRYRSPSMPNVGDRLIPTTNTNIWERENNSSYIYDADHLWIKNVSLGYTLHSTKLPFQDIRIYANVDNFLLFSRYPGGNPDVNNYGGLQWGSDDESYPLPRTFTVGLNLTL